MRATDGGVFDAWAALPGAAQVRDAVARRDWQAARTVLSAAPPYECSALVSLAGEQPTAEDVARQGLVADPDDSLAAAVLGARLISTGWQIRTAARAQHVSRNQFAQFHAWLRQAEQTLIEAVARNPETCAVWCQRLVSARGLELGLSEVRRRYDRLAAIDPQHLHGQRSMLQSLCPKWSGSWPDAHAFARECMLAAPPGSPHAVLVAEAHLEQWLDFGEPWAGAAYLRGEPVRAQLHEAAHRSVFHPQFQPGYRATWAVNVFAMLFSLMGDDTTAAPLFAMIGNVPTEGPWDYLDAPAAQFRARRDRALAAGGGR